MIKHQVIDLLFKCPCQVYVVFVMFPMTAQYYPFKYISFTVVYLWEAGGLVVWACTQMVVGSIPATFSVGVFAVRESINVV